MITSATGADTAPSEPLEPRPVAFGTPGLDTPGASPALGLIKERMIAAALTLDDKHMIATFRRQGMSDAQIGHMIGASRTAVYRAGRGLHSLRARAHATLQIAYLSLPVPGKGADHDTAQPAD